MLDSEMTAARTRTKRETPRGPARPSRRAGHGEDDGFGRREVIVQGMRITLPALRFMDRPAPGPRGR